MDQAGEGLGVLARIAYATGEALGFSILNTKTLPRRTLVFLYARISEDPRDRRRGVNRQMSDLRTFSEENGWEVGGEYIENDVSAHSGEERPEYDRLMADAIEAAREPGVRVIVAGYHPSRVWRRRVERAGDRGLAARGLLGRVRVRRPVQHGEGVGPVAARQPR